MRTFEILWLLADLMAFLVLSVPQLRARLWMRHLPAIAGPIGEQRAHGIVKAYSLAFFDRHLLGHPAMLLDGAAKQYPEVLFESRRP